MDDFETVRTTAWEGVRNAEARNLMKEMAVGDQVCLNRYKRRSILRLSFPRFCSTTLIARIRVWLRLQKSRKRLILTVCFVHLITVLGS